MRPIVRAALSIFASSLLVGVVCAGLLVARLMPWWASVPAGVLWPLMRALLFHAFEWTTLLAVPLGIGWFSATEGPRHWLLLGAFLVAIGSLQAVMLTRSYEESEAPGRLVQRLVEESQQSCLQTAGREVAIPIVGLKWTCQGAIPKIQGKLGALGASFSARSLQASDDLRGFKFTELRLLVKSKGFPESSLRVRQASVSGLRSWGRPTTNQFGGRVPFVILSTWALVWIAVRFASRWARGRRLIGGVLGLGPALIMVLIYIYLDQHNSAGWCYWVLPLALVAGSEAAPVLLARIAIQINVAKATSRK